MRTLILFVVALLSLSQSLQAQGSGWILWEHNSYQRFTAKDQLPTIDTWEIYGGFQDIDSCNARAVTIVKARIAFFNDKSDAEKKKAILLHSDLDRHRIEYHADVSQMSPPELNLKSTLTTESYICLPSNFDPREKK